MRNIASVDMSEMATLVVRPWVQAETSELRAQLDRRSREVRELNQMLKAWEAMRHSKDQQIAQLVARCKKFEEEAAEKNRAAGPHMSTHFSST